MSEYKEGLTEDELLKKQEELEKREAVLNQKEKEINALDKKVTNAKYNLYSRIHTTKETMDKVVILISALLVIAVAAAIMTRG